MPKTSPPTNRKAAFLAALDWKIAVDWLGAYGIHELDDMRRVTIEIAENRYAQHYPGVMVVLIHKTTGSITSHYFFFEDHIPRTSCTDGGNPHGKDQKLHAWQDRDKFEWYILMPRDRKATRPFCQAVEDWIATWK